MANTRDSIGDQATVDGLVANSLTSLEEDGVMTLGAYALRARNALTSISLPSVTNINAYAVAGCTGITTIDLISTSPVTISANAFDSSTNLTHLVNRSTTKSTLANINAFNGTKIQSGNGAIYVPSDLVSTYKADSKWGAYIILPISSYPASDFSTISDSWATILANTTPSSSYSVGDIKALSVYGVSTYAQIVGFDEGSSKISWLTKGIITTHNMNSSAVTTNGWAESGMRSWLRSDVLPTLPQEIQDAIVAVDKTYYDYTTSSTLTISDTVWIPSAREIFGGTSYESSGVDYTSWFDTTAKRIKYNASGTASYWWLRSAISGTSFRGVNGSGSATTTGANGTSGVALGFCTGNPAA